MSRGDLQASSRNKRIGEKTREDRLGRLLATGCSLWRGRRGRGSQAAGPSSKQLRARGRGLVRAGEQAREIFSLNPVQTAWSEVWTGQAVWRHLGDVTCMQQGRALFGRLRGASRAANGGGRGGILPTNRRLPLQTSTPWSATREQIHLRSKMATRPRLSAWPKL